MRLKLNESIAAGHHGWLAIPCAHHVKVASWSAATCTECTPRSLSEVEFEPGEQRLPAGPDMFAHHAFSAVAVFGGDEVEHDVMFAV